MRTLTGGAHQGARANDGMQKIRAPKLNGVGLHQQVGCAVADRGLMVQNTLAASWLVGKHRGSRGGMGRDEAIYNLSREQIPNSLYTHFGTVSIQQGRIFYRKIESQSHRKIII